jgi:GTP pyrophosphokinase
MQSRPPAPANPPAPRNRPAVRRKAVLGVNAASGSHGPAATTDKPLAVSLAGLLEKLGNYLTEADLQHIRAAYRFADAAHLGQYRASGEPYISHPVAVAELCADWKLDTQALMAALLHDTAEDKGITQAELIEHFGPTVAVLVDGLTKLDKIQFSNREENQAESFRKMLLAMARDIRVILIKLADRLHNMRTLGAMAPDKRRRIATETMDIYAPIAYRLGLNQVYRELQDLGFLHRHPMRYGVLIQALKVARGNRRDLVDKILAATTKAFADAGIDVHLHGREKTLYSIYRKMQRKHRSFAHVQDIFGFRVIVPDVLGCYRALGVLHAQYKPMPGKFEDFIAIPKLNGYQSLHTTLIGPTGAPVEFQIRTEAMHRVAESGVAAHWLYKTSSGAEAIAQVSTAAWLQSLLDIQNENRDAAEFIETVKVDLAPDAVYVFTPKSRILALPRGATPVDFSYAVHTDLGNQTVAAKVNGELVPLRTELHSGDVVEIVTAPHSRPNPNWLSFVRTGRARSKIRHELKVSQQAESQDLGKRFLGRAMLQEGRNLDDLNAADWSRLLHWSGNKSQEDLFSDIGLGKRVAEIVAKRAGMQTAHNQNKSQRQAAGYEAGAMQDAGQAMAPTEVGVSAASSRTALQLDGSEGASVHYADCCHPIPGDAVLGYLGKGEGLTVHLQDCPQARRLFQKHPRSWIDLSWSPHITGLYQVGMSVIVSNGKGVLAKLASAISERDADIIHVTMDDDSGQPTIELRFVLAVRDRKHLADILRAVRAHKFVVRASRGKPRQNS